MAALVAGAMPAAAFKTRVKIGLIWVGEDIHKAISKDALGPLGFKEESLLEINRGTASQDQLTSSKFTSSPQNHCDDNLFLQGRAYYQERFEAAALFFSDVLTDAKAKDAIRFRFGEGLHTLQDFYSHSNYLEGLLAAGKPLVPVAWESLSAPPMGPQGRTGIRSGFFHWDGGWHGYYDNEATSGRADSMAKLKAAHPGEKYHFRTDAQYNIHSARTPPPLAKALDYALIPGDFMHFEINKDNEKQIQGRIVSPKHGKTLHRLAWELASKDTARQWELLEERVCREEGPKAAWIVPAIKGGEYPKLGSQVKGSGALSRGKPVRASLRINVSNMDRGVREKLERVGRPLKLVVSAELNPGAKRAEKTLVYDGKPTVDLVVEKDLPINVPDDARDEVTLSITTRFEDDPLNQPSTAEATLSVVDVTKSVLFLVDTSSSMAGPRIKEARAAIGKVVRDAAIAGHDYEWALLSFGEHQVREIEEFTKNGSRIIESAERNLNAAGDTPLHYAEAKALTYLLQNGKAKDGLMIILCDGEDNCIGPKHAKTKMSQTLQEKAASSAARGGLLKELRKKIELPGLEGRSP